MGKSNGSGAVAALFHVDFMRFTAEAGDGNPGGEFDGNVVFSRRSLTFFQIGAGDPGIRRFFMDI